jgi:hypothetical protein
MGPTARARHGPLRGAERALLVCVGATRKFLSHGAHESAAAPRGKRGTVCAEASGNTAAAERHTAAEGSVVRSARPTKNTEFLPRTHRRILRGSRGRRSCCRRRGRSRRRCGRGNRWCAFRRRGRRLSGGWSRALPAGDCVHCCLTAGRKAGHVFLQASQRGFASGRNGRAMRHIIRAARRSDCAQLRLRRLLSARYRTNRGNAHQRQNDRRHLPQFLAICAHTGNPPVTGRRSFLARTTFYPSSL